MVYLAGDKILYGGDLAAGGRQPFMQSPDVDPAAWERVLQALARVPVEKFVPGHGEIGTATDIKDSLAYVHAVNVLAKKFVDAGTADTMIDGQLRDPENTIANVPLTRRAHRQRQGLRQGDAREGREEDDARRGARPDAREEVMPVKGSPAGAGVRLERSRGGARADLSIDLPPVNVLGPRRRSAISPRRSRRPRRRACSS